MEDRGLEPVAFPCGNRLVAGHGGAKSGAVRGENDPITLDLASVIAAWGSLTKDTRRNILAIVEAEVPYVLAEAFAGRLLSPQDVC